MNIEKSIQEQLQEQRKYINDVLPKSFNDIKEDIIKAKKAQIGEVREWSGVKMRKEATGWVPVKDAKGKSNDKEDSKEKGSEEVPTLEEHAKNASEQALQNAIKASSDPKVREAAHKELQRRKTEEAQETFKSPEKSEGKEENDKS